MLSRISGLFKEQEAKPKFADLLLQIKNLSSEEKQIIKNVLSESEQSEQLVKKQKTETETEMEVVKEIQTQVVVKETETTYEYKEEPYKRRTRTD